MRPPRAQFHIRSLMTVVAVVAGLSAWLRVPGAIALTFFALLVLVPTFLALFAHILFARPGYRLLVAAWVASLWPVFFLWSLHVAWITAYGFLGRRSGVRDCGLVIGVLGQSVLLEMILAMLSPVACLLLTVVPTEKPVAVKGRWDARALPLVLTPLVWMFVFAVIVGDPLGAVMWIMGS